MTIDRALFLVLAASLAGAACGGYAPPPQDPSENDPTPEATSAPTPPPPVSHITAHEAPTTATPPAPQDEGEFHPSGEGFQPSGDGYKSFGDGFKPFGDGSTGHPSNEGS